MPHRCRLPLSSVPFEPRTRRPARLWARPNWRAAIAACLSGPLLAGCQSPMPSERLASALTLPAPGGHYLPPATAPASRPSPTQPAVATAKPTTAPATVLRLSPLSVIHLAFNHQPFIKQRYQAFKAEEARYDFFYTSRDSFTPGIRISTDLQGTRSPDEQQRDRQHVVELVMEKRFFNTSRLSFNAGYKVTGQQWTGAQANHPFLSATLRYPLWGSRQALQRASEQIERQNDVNDAQLRYLEAVRWRLQWALASFYETIELRERVKLLDRWLDDLRDLTAKVQATNRNPTADLRRIQAEITSVQARRRELQGRYEIELGALKANIGLPFDCRLELIEEPFNPFAGLSLRELVRLSVTTDPEIATHRNAIRDAQAQLELARRGKWDTALLLSGESQIEGSQDDQGQSEWSVSAALEFRAVDRRVTTSLEREALASIKRAQQAIRARRNDIYVGALAPLTRMRTLTTNIEQLTANLDRYVRDYNTGLAEYARGKLNIDDLLTRRANLFEQQQAIIESKKRFGVSVARLCAATGKFFELLQQR